jgi:monofunctional biosynthetic peptidoglycan transglycosylase
MQLARKKKKGYIKRILGKGLRLMSWLLLVFIILTFTQVAVIRYVDPPFTVYMAWIRIKNIFSSTHTIVPEYKYRSLQDISPSLIKAVLAGEDQRFMTHHGFDFREINQVIREIMEGKRARGASTITMQVARSIFLWPGRSLLRKCVEAYYTILIEIFLTKERIIELYLNVVDWGTGTLGAEAASQKYFNKRVSDITPAQAASMAAILPNPHLWSPVNPSDQVKERRNRIMRDMEKMHL